jgi:hypothetical protein
MARLNVWGPPQKSERRAEKREEKRECGGVAPERLEETIPLP